MTVNSIKNQTERRELAINLREWLRVAREPLVLSDERPSLSDSDVLDVVSRLLAERDDLLARRVSELNALPGGQWLREQREIGRAIDLLYGKRRKRKGEAPAHSDQASPSDRAGRLLADVRNSTRHYDKDFGLYSAISGLAQSPYGSHYWPYECVQAIAEYLEGTAAERLLEAQKKYEAASLQFVEAARAFLEVAHELEALQLPGLRRLAPLSLPKAIAGTQLDLRDYEFPLRRRSEGQDEKLFVFRLYEANRREVRSPRAEVIHELMHMEIFERQFDRRHLDRLIADFTANKEARIERQRAGQESIQKQFQTVMAKQADEAA